MLKKTVYSIAISLILLTPFIYSNELYNRVIIAKQIWFYGAMALLMLVTAVDLIFDRRSFVLRFNKIDLALLAFYAYYTIRAATTSYMRCAVLLSMPPFTLSTITITCIEKAQGARYRT